MGLQIRLRHALGERVVEVRPRTVDRALVIGRSKEADLQIPSVTVAAQHCVLFVHEGQWVVQDMVGGTLLNDAPIAGPTALYVGDILTIGGGTAPATIEIDPAGVEAGRTGAPAAESVATPLPTAAPVAASAATSRAPQAVAAPGYGRAPTRPMTASMPSAFPPPLGAQTAGAGDEDSVDWNFASSGDPSSPAPRRRKPPQSNLGAMVAVGVIAVVVIVGVTIAIISYTRPAPPSPAPKKIVEDDSRHVHSIFDIPNDKPTKARPRAKAPAPTRPPAAVPDSSDDSSSATPPPADAPTAVASAAPTPVPASGSSAPADDPDSHADDPDWNSVDEASGQGDHATALLKFDDYARKHPGKNSAQLKKFEDDALSTLWFQRITELCNKRARCTKDIADKERDLRESRDAAFKAQTAREKQAAEVERQRADDTLRNKMGYTAEAAPDIADKQQMASLRQNRNPDLFADWSKKTAHYIRQNHGQTPWGGEE